MAHCAGLQLVPKRSERSERSAGLVVCHNEAKKKVNSVSKRPFFSALLIASEFRFFPIFKKFSRLKNATTFGIVIFFLVLFWCVLKKK
jgi:hypothetical protein